MTPTIDPAIAARIDARIAQAYADIDREQPRSKHNIFRAEDPTVRIAKYRHSGGRQG